MPVRMERRHGTGSSNFDNFHTSMNVSRMSITRPGTQGATRRPTTSTGTRKPDQSVKRPQSSMGLTRPSGQGNNSKAEKKIRNFELTGSMPARLSDGTEMGERKPFIQDLEQEEQDKNPRLRSSLDGTIKFDRPTTAPKNFYRRPNAESGAIEIPRGEYKTEVHEKPLEPQAVSPGIGNNNPHGTGTLGNSSTSDAARAMSSMSVAHPTGGSLREGGLMTTLTRPSTALGLSRASYGTRPALDFPEERETMRTPPPVSNEIIQALKADIYSRAVDVRQAFRNLDRDKNGTVERDEFRKGVAEMRMKIEPEAVESLIRFLDPDDNGRIDYSEFAEALALKESFGQYNPFLLERSYKRHDDSGKVPPKSLQNMTAGGSDTKRRRRAGGGASGAEVKKAYELQARLQAEFEKRYGQPSQMFRQCDGDHNGCISIDEFVDKTRHLDMQPRITRADVENMTEVLQFAEPGHITYHDFIEHFKFPDKWGHCSAFSSTLPLGRSGENPPPIDSATLEREWARQGRKHPKDLLKDKKKAIKDMIEDGRSLPCRENKTGGILIKGLAKEGHLDKFLLHAIKDKIKTMKSNSRAVFRSWDPYKEGRVSKANFHRGIERLGMAIPSPAVEEMIGYLDEDNNGYIELDEWLQVMDADPQSQASDLGKHTRKFPFDPETDKRASRETRRLLKGGVHPKDPPKKETHHLSAECEKTGEVSDELLNHVRKKMLERNNDSAKLFRTWDRDKNGHIDPTEIRKGLEGLELGLPHKVLARIAHVIGHSSGNPKGLLNFASFCKVFKPPPRDYGKHETTFEITQSRVFEGVEPEVTGVVMYKDGSAGLKQTRSATRTSMGANLAGVGAGQTKIFRASLMGRGPSAWEEEQEHVAPTHTSQGREFFYDSSAVFSHFKQPKEETRKLAGAPWTSSSRQDLRSSWSSRTMGKRQEILRARSQSAMGGTLRGSDSAIGDRWRSQSVME